MKKQKAKKRRPKIVEPTLSDLDNIFRDTGTIAEYQVDDSITADLMGDGYGFEMGPGDKFK